MLGAPIVDLALNCIAQLARAGEAFFVRPGEAGWIRKTPMQSLAGAENRRTCGYAGSITDRDHVIKAHAALQHFIDAARAFPRNIEADFAQRLDHRRIQIARLEPRAFSDEKLAARLIE